MDSRIKTGENLKCDYTGEKAKALIKIYGKDSEEETKWMGTSVLSQALRLLTSVEPESTRDHTGCQVADKMPNWIEPESAPIQLSKMIAVAPAPVIPATVRTPGRSVKIPAEVVENFAEACRELKENPPANKDGKVNGVPESSIREIIKNFLPYFKENPNQMFTPLRVVFSFDLARFKTIVEGLERKRG